MERDVISARVDEDQEEVAKKIARYDFLALPIVDGTGKLVGIVTHDDVIDVVREEAVEDVQRLGGVAPLTVGYLQTRHHHADLEAGHVAGDLVLDGPLHHHSALKRYEDAQQQFAVAGDLPAADHVVRRQFRQPVGHAHHLRALDRRCHRCAIGTS